MNFQEIIDAVNLEQTEYTFTVPVGPMPRAAVASVEGKQAVMRFEFTGSKLL